MDSGQSMSPWGMGSSELMVGRRACALPCFSLFLEMCWRWGGKKNPMLPSGQLPPGGLPSAPKTGVLFSPTEHETTSAQMNGGNGNVGQGSRGYLWQDSGILGMTTCSQYCFHSTFRLFFHFWPWNDILWQTIASLVLKTYALVLPTSGGTFIGSSQASPFLEAPSVHWVLYLEHLQLPSAPGNLADLWPGLTQHSGVWSSERTWYA